MPLNSGVGELVLVVWKGELSCGIWGIFFFRSVDGVCMGFSTFLVFCWGLGW